MRQRFASHLPGLDGVRGLAILLVVAHNVGYFEEPTDSLTLKLIRFVCGPGWVGVQLFFVLSGFLITRILLDTKGSESYFQSFYVRRVLRIFPLYYLTLVGAFLVLPHLMDLGEWGQRARSAQVWYWTYLVNWTNGGPLAGLGHFWSLAVEEQFYLIWPFVVSALAWRQVLRVSSFLIVSALIMRFLMVFYWHAPAEAVYTFTFTRWDAIGWGAWIAIASRDDRAYASLVRMLRVLGGISALVVAGIAVAEKSLSWTLPIVQTVGFSALAILFALVIVTVIDASQPGGWLRRLMGASWLRFFGKYSYGLYVVHWPVHRLGQVLLTRWVVGISPTTRVTHLLAYLALNLVASTAIAVGVWHLVEKRALALKDVWAPRRALA